MATCSREQGCARGLDHGVDEVVAGRRRGAVKMKTWKRISRTPCNAAHLLRDAGGRTTQRLLARGRRTDVAAPCEGAADVCFDDAGGQQHDGELPAGG